nr:hypothetical protein BaRGS_031902 [Batillaria attramentaria]
MVSQPVVSGCEAEDDHLPKKKKSHNEIRTEVKIRVKSWSSHFSGADVMHTWRRLETVAGSQIRRSAS